MVRHGHYWRRTGHTVLPHALPNMPLNAFGTLSKHVLPDAFIFFILMLPLASSRNGPPSFIAVLEQKWCPILRQNLMWKDHWFWMILTPFFIWHQPHQSPPHPRSFCIPAKGNSFEVRPSFTGASWRGKPWWLTMSSMDIHMVVAGKISETGSFVPAMENVCKTPVASLIVWEELKLLHPS